MTAMKRQIIVITALLLASGSSVAAQQPAKAVPRIGLIVSASNPSSPQLNAFRLASRVLGYVEGKNILIERRYAEGRLDRMAEIVKDLVQQRVDLILAPNNVAIRAA